MRSSSILFCSLIFICAGTLPAGVIQVASSKDAQDALKKARPGDEIVLADGTYKDCYLFMGNARTSRKLTPEEEAAELEKIRNPPPSPAPELPHYLKDEELTANAVGTADSPITFRAANPGKVVLTGDSGIRVVGKYLIVEGFVFDQAWRKGGPIILLSTAEHCRITNCAFIECGNPDSTFGRIIDVTQRSRNNRIDHCLMKGNLSIGMGLKLSPYDYDSSHLQCDHNYFKDIIRRSTNGQEAIQFGQGGFPGKYNAHRDGHGIAEYNLFENASGDAEICSDKSSRNIYRFNTFRDCKGELCLRGGRFARVEGNCFFGNGIRVMGGNHLIINNYFENVPAALNMPPGTDQNLIAHNTVVNSKVGILLGRPHISAGKDPVRNNTFANNLIQVDQGKAIEDLLSENNRWVGNMISGGGTSAEPKREGVQVVESPLERDERTGIYRPDRNSAALNAGEKLAEVTDDIDGQAREAKVEIGCDEVSSSVADANRKVLRPEDAGPVWMKGNIGSIARITNPQPIPALPK